MRMLEEPARGMLLFLCSPSLLLFCGPSVFFSLLYLGWGYYFGVSGIERICFLFQKINPFVRLRSRRAILKSRKTSQFTESLRMGQAAIGGPGLVSL